jgi:CcmD family protein
MNPIPFLYAAYIITWVIHGLFLFTLVTRYRKAERELREFQKK